MKNVMLLVAPGAVLFVLGIVMIATTGPGVFVVVLGALLMVAGAGVYSSTHEDPRG